MNITPNEMNKYIAVIKKAYEQNEMVELFGCKESYSLNEKGEYYLKQDIRLGGATSDPINMEALLSASEMYYCSLDKKNKKEFSTSFIDTLIKLAESRNIQDLYFATEIYCILGNREHKDSFYPLKGICNQIKDKIETNIMERSSELKLEKVYAGTDQVDGLWSILHTMNALVSNEIKIQGLD